MNRMLVYVTCFHSASLMKNFLWVIGNITFESQQHIIKVFTWTVNLYTQFVKKKKRITNQNVKTNNQVLPYKSNLMFIYDIYVSE